jgi:DNA/RNA endonuclease G (NUC1)
MYGAQKNFFASQYIIDNEIIIENNKFRYNPYKEYIIGIDKIEEYIQKAKLNFEPSIVQFLNTL